MSDMKKYEQVMGQHTDYVNRSRELTPQDMRHFNRDAITCELCGQLMIVNPEDGTNYKADGWEQKWSIHRVCAHAMQRRLDRESGILNERTQRDQTRQIPGTNF